MTKIDQPKAPSKQKEIKREEVAKIAIEPQEEVVFKSPVKARKKVPFFIPLLRSKYLHIELLRYLFTYRYEVAIFLRRIN